MALEANPHGLDHRVVANTQAMNQRLFETSIDLIFVIDSKDALVRVSPSCRSVLGYEPIELVGHKATEFTQADDRESMRDELWSSRADGKERRFQNRYLHKDGRVATIAWNGLWSDKDEQHLLVGRDITEQALAEDKFRLAVEACPSGIVMIDSSGAIVLVNAETERLFGYQRAELIGKSIDMLVPPSTRARHAQHRSGFIHQPVARRMGVGRNLNGLRKDGSEFPVEIGLNPIQTQDDLLVLSVIVDITERELAQSRLQNLQAELLHLSRLTTMGQMASSLAHELNQPLTAIANYVEGCRMLLNKFDPKNLGTIRDTMGLVSEQALRAGTIIRRLREFVSRGETSRRVENLSELVEEASALALIGVKEAGIEVIFDFHSRDAQVYADKTQIQQVCMNLIRNAVEAMHGCENKTLRIGTAAADGGMTTIHVIDTGVGISEEVAKQLFQPFVTTKSEGMGVGLSICRGIVEAHGGRIECEANPGGGTNFHFSLQTVEPAETADA